MTKTMRDEYVGFMKWLDTFISEKGIDRDELLEVEGPSGLNIMPVSMLVGLIKTAPKNERNAIKSMLVKIDFVNGDVRKYLAHLAKAVSL